MSDFDYKATELYDYILEIEEKEKIQRKVRRYSLVASLVLSGVIFGYSWYNEASGVGVSPNAIQYSDDGYIRITADQFHPQAVKELLINSGKHIVVESRHGISNDTLRSVGDVNRFSKIDDMLKKAKAGSGESIGRSGPFFLADQMPDFPGGQDALARYLQAQLQYPTEARNNRIEGSVQVRFVIESDGSIAKPEVIKGIGFGCDEEAIRLISQMPKWNPGKIGKNTVPVYKALTIQFQLL